MDNLSKILNFDEIEKTHPSFNNKPILKVETINSSNFYCPLIEDFSFLTSTNCNNNNNNNNSSSTNNSNNSTPTKIPINFFLNPQIQQEEQSKDYFTNEKKKKFKPQKFEIKISNFQFDQTPLFIASYHNNVNSLKNMELCGTDLNHHGKNGWSPLMYASQENNIEIVDILIKNRSTKIDSINFEGNSSLYIACLNSNIKIVEKLLSTKNVNVNIQNKVGCSPLMISASIGNIEIIKLLLENGANINLIDNQGNNALMYCLIYGYNLNNLLNNNNNNQNNINEIDIENKILIINLLIENGSNINQISNDEWTPLKLSIKHALNINEIKPILSKLLINQSSSSSLQMNQFIYDSQGWTPIKIAIRYSSITIIQYIISFFSTIEFSSFLNLISTIKNNIFDYFKLAIQFRSIDIYFYLYNLFLSNNNDKDYLIFNKNDINSLISICTDNNNNNNIDSLKIIENLKGHIIKFNL